MTALVPSRPPDLHYYDSQRSPSAASTLISWSGLATRAKTQYRTPCCLSLHAPSINHSSLSKPASFRSCGSDLHHISLPLDRSVFCCPKPNHWTLPTFTSFTCDSEVHIPTPPSAQALSNLPARSLSYLRYGHKVIPLSTSLEHPNLRNTTRLPWSRARLHTRPPNRRLSFSRHSRTCINLDPYCFYYRTSNPLIRTGLPLPLSYLRHQSNSTIEKKPTHRTLE